ncbi:MAG: hypothetical protein AAGD18_13675 [Actinomycetota bacterium]
MERSRPPLRIIALLAALLLVVASCGGSSGDEVDAVGPDVAIEATPAFLASVADRSEELGFRYEMLLSMELDMAFEAMSIAPDEPFAYGTQQSADRLSMTMDMGVLFESMADELGPLGAGLPDGDDLVMEMVVDGDRMWMRAPMFAALAELDPLAASDPTLGPLMSLGDQWGVVELSELGDVLPAGDLAQAAGGQSMSPDQMLSLLRNVTAVDELGEQDVRGVSTTGLRATVTLGDLMAAQGQSVEDLTAQLGAGVDPITARELGSTFEAILDVPAVLTAWVDGSGYLRRFETEIDLGTVFEEIARETGEVLPGGMSFSVGYVMDFYDYGADITVDVPDVQDPVDITAIIVALANGSTFS